MPPRRKSGSALRFDQRLVLSQWVQSLFESSDFEELADQLAASELEGLDEENVTRFHRRLTLRSMRDTLPDDVLLGYDANIVRHWQHITASRGAGQRIHMKSFQYLALLFSEIYLDRYFS